MHEIAPRYTTAGFPLTTSSGPRTGVVPTWFARVPLRYASPAISKLLLEALLITESSEAVRGAFIPVSLIPKGCSEVITGALAKLVGGVTSGPETRMKTGDVVVVTAVPPFLFAST